MRRCCLIPDAQWRVEARNPGGESYLSYDPQPDRVVLRFTHGLLLLRAPFEGVVQIRVTYGGAFAPRRSWDIALDKQDRPLTLQTTATDEALIITAAPPTPISWMR